jgi:branched-chain amino acid transport system substrate-binding protein
MLTTKPMAATPCRRRARKHIDGVHLLAAALRQSNAIEGSKILDALENLNEPIEGVVTTYRQPFSASNHEAYSAETAVMGELRHGHLVLADERAKSK